MMRGLSDGILPYRRHGQLDRPRVEAFSGTRTTSEHENLGWPQGLQIEHVMPQSWKKNWLLPTEDGRPAESLEADRKIAIADRANSLLDISSPSGRARRRRRLARKH